MNYTPSPEVLSPNPSTPDLSSLPENWQTFLQENHDALNIQQISAAINYLQEIKWNFQSSLEQGITIDDFEKIKKIDADNDGEAGEKE